MHINRPIYLEYHSEVIFYISLKKMTSSNVTGGFPSQRPDVYHTLSTPWHRPARPHQWVQTTKSEKVEGTRVKKLINKQIWNGSGMHCGKYKARIILPTYRRQGDGRRGDGGGSGFRWVVGWWWWCVCVCVCGGGGGGGGGGALGSLKPIHPISTLLKRGISIPTSQRRGALIIHFIYPWIQVWVNLVIWEDIVPIMTSLQCWRKYRSDISLLGACHNYITRLLQ